MRNPFIACLLATFLSGIAAAHEAVTIGPNGGRVIYLDSPAVPSAEILINAEGRAEIFLLDKDRKPLAPDGFGIQVTTGPRSRVKKLEGAAQDKKYVTAAVPVGAPYYLVVQIRTGTDAKALIARLHYDPRPAASGKPAYLDDSVNANSGENITVPETASGIWAELNQHQMELVENLAGKNYEAIDEVTRAYPVLAKGLAAQSGDRPAASGLIETLLGHLAAVREANAARTLEAAADAMAGIASTLAELKKLYPADTANATL